ncbi:BatA domain-containing protein, partial [candidate division WOR-3 bacterium]|nr:BatA domain-containing protein [candidate division WOR-3 bacterium]
MFFLAPIYLLGLLSLPIPFILHLFEKRRVKQVDFPWLYLVEESIKGGNLFLRLREWILLALRTLVLLFLVVAFASPIVRRDRGVILIDDSYDMFSRRGDGILFDEAKGIAEKIAREKGYDIVLSSGRQYKDDILPSYMMLQPLEVEDENIVFIT